MYRYFAYRRLAKVAGLSGGPHRADITLSRSALARQPWSSGDPVSSGPHAQRSSRDLQDRVALNVAGVIVSRRRARGEGSACCDLPHATKSSAPEQEPALRR